MAVWMLSLALVAADNPLADLLEIGATPRVTAATCELTTLSFLNRDYRLMAAPPELVDLPRLVFDGGSGHRLEVAFRQRAVVLGCFQYNTTGSWDWPDRKPPSEHGWTLYRKQGYRGTSNGLKQGRPSLIDVYYRVYEPGAKLIDLSPWWVCLAVVSADELPKLLAAPRDAPLAVAKSPEFQPAIVAHRGLLKLAPENTIPAFRAALAVGLGIEFDVSQTKDGKIAILHDNTVDRTTDGHGKIADLTWAEVQKLDAGSWFHPDFAGTRIPLLSDVLELARTESPKPTPLAVNLKRVDAPFIRHLCDELVKSGVADRCFLFDVPLKQAAAYKEVAQGVALAAAGQNEPAYRQALANPAIDAVWIYFVPTREQIKLAEAAGKAIHVTPFVDAQREKAWRALQAAGVTSFCTDFAAEVRRVWRPWEWK